MAADWPDLDSGRARLERATRNTGSTIVKGPWSSPIARSVHISHQGRMPTNDTRPDWYHRLSPETRADFDTHAHDEDFLEADETVVVVIPRKPEPERPMSKNKRKHVLPDWAKVLPPE